MADYTRLTGLDEEGAHAQLQDHLRSLVDPKITEHRGRIVKNTGDGLLAEFSSVNGCETRTSVVSPAGSSVSIFLSQKSNGVWLPKYGVTWAVGLIQHRGGFNNPRFRDMDISFGLG